MSVSATVYKKTEENNNDNSGLDNMVKELKEMSSSDSRQEARDKYNEIIKEIKEKIGEMPKMPSGLPKGKWTKQAIKVLKERYLDRDKNGEVIETPEEMIWRVSWEIASAEARWGADRDQVLKQAKTFFKLLVSRNFLPNSPTLMNAGKGNNLQYSACFVLPVEDSLEGIFDAIKWQGLIHQSGGGTGFSFSRLRSQGSLVSSSRGVASGPVSFMKIFDSATQQVKQGGTRRGANMGMLRIDHPDIREFITCKLEGGITNFNISVLATDEFMKALDSDEEYDLIDPSTEKPVGKEKAREVFEEICQAAWQSGDPGMVFVDKINDGSANPVPALGPVESTNPCGEQPLYPFDACNLGSIFLRYYVKDDDGESKVDWDKLKESVHTSVRFLDNVIEVNPYPLPQIWKTVRGLRRIGLGIGGWSDMLFKLGITYDSQEAFELAEKIMEFIRDEGHKASNKLAEERGSFPLWEQSIYVDEKPMRNATVTTIAPTGTISIIANNSSGVEPIFALAYIHHVKDEHLDRKLTFVNPVFEEIAKKEGFWSDDLKKKVAKTGTVKDIDEVPEKWQEIFMTSHQIKPDSHVKMQAAWQKYTDNAVSKTINLPFEAEVEDVAKAYLKAYRLGCMGITVYRDGSKDQQVLNVGSEDEEKSVEVKKSGIKDQVAELRRRPEKLEGSTYKVRTPIGNAYVSINSDEMGNPFEVFITVGKAGTDVMADAEAIGRLVSLSLRIPTELPAETIAEQVVEQLAGIGGSGSVGFGNGKVRSLADGVAKALREHLDGKKVSKGNGVEVEIKQSEREMEMIGQQAALPLTKKRHDICPECGQASLVLEEGCSKCYVCGHSKC